MREDYWVNRVSRQQATPVIALCGLIHLDPFTEKLKARGCQVEEKINVCEAEWYKKNVGTFQIHEQSGNRWAEFHPLKLS
jgi:hypothetical protein